MPRSQVRTLERASNRCSARSARRYVSCVRSSAVSGSTNAATKRHTSACVKRTKAASASGSPSRAANAQRVASSMSSTTLTIAQPMACSTAGTISLFKTTTARGGTGVKRVAWAAVATVIVLLGLQSPAFAHAVLIRSTPPAGSTVQEPPREVVLTFSENVKPVADKIRVIGPDGNQADTGKVTANGANVTIKLKDNPPKGTYLVSYRVISADSHPVPGGFTF